MKNSFNLGFIVLVLVVLGCSCPKLGELTKSDNTTVSPPPPTSNTSNSPTTSNSSASTAGTGVSMNKYNQIKTDMKKSEVEKLIGSAGEEVSSSSGGGSTFSTYKWTGDNFATIIITFRDDKVMSKSQYGLK